MTFSSIFSGPDGRLRSGWRFGVFSALFIVAGVFLSGIAFVLTSPLGVETGPGSSAFLFVNGLLMTAAALLIGWLCASRLEGLSFSSLGASFSTGWLQNLLFASLL